MISVHVYAVREAERLAGEHLLADAGFARELEPRTFHQSLLVSTDGTAEERLARFSYAARRGIRQVTERGYIVAPVRDTSAAERIAWLHAEAHRRTGGHAQPLDARSAIKAAQNDPAGSVVLGVFHPDRPHDTALVGFAHAYTSGCSVVYGSAGTERADDIGSTPLSYGLVAHLLDWAAAIGCSVFDFGGVTPVEAPNHPLSGISEFKRKFRGREMQVASDFRVAVKPLGAAMLRIMEWPARAVGRR